MSELRESEPHESEPRVPGPRRTRGAGRVVLVLLAALLGGAFVGQAASAAEPPVPEDVAAYFATGLIPRLADLYGAGTGTDAAFDDTTKVGTIHRLLAWTPDFLAGKKTDTPTELTNTWIAPVTAKSGTILGLAAVWINPGSSVVELADFSRGRALVDALGRAPQDTLLIDDAAQQAWFATDGTTLTPLVVGTSKTTGPLTPAEYQAILRANATPATPSQTATNPGLLIAGITLGAVVVLLAVFILLPGRKRRNGAADADAPAADTPVAGPAEAPPAPTRPKRTFEADPEPGAPAPKRSFEPDPGPAATKTKPRKATPRKAARPATAVQPASPTVAEPVEAEAAQARTAPVKTAQVKTVRTKTAQAKTTAARSTAAKTASPRPAPKKAPASPPAASE